MDYTKLRDLLAEGKFEDADDETRALLIKLAGPGAVDRKWVYFTEVLSPTHTCVWTMACQIVWVREPWSLLAANAPHAVDMVGPAGEVHPGAGLAHRGRAVACGQRRQVWVQRAEGDLGAE